MSPRLGANDQQVRYVRARDQEHETHGALDDPERPLQVADELAFEGPHDRPVLLDETRVLRGAAEPLGETPNQLRQLLATDW